MRDPGTGDWNCAFSGRGLPRPPVHGETSARYKPSWPPDSLEGVDIFALAKEGRVRVLRDGFLTECPRTGEKHEGWTPVFEGEPEFLSGLPLNRPTLVHSSKPVRESYYSAVLEVPPPEAA